MNTFPIQNIILVPRKKSKLKQTFFQTIKNPQSKNWGFSYNKKEARRPLFWLKNYLRTISLPQQVNSQQWSWPGWQASSLSQSHSAITSISKPQSWHLYTSPFFISPQDTAIFLPPLIFLFTHMNVHSSFTSLLYPYGYIYARLFEKFFIFLFSLLVNSTFGGNLKSPHISL